MTEHSNGEQAPTVAYLDELTGVRTGKRSYYPEYMRSAARLEGTVRALDQISRALVRTAEGPRTLVEAVVRAAAEHLQAQWLLFAVAEGALQAARPRFLLLADDSYVEDEAQFPPAAAEALRVLRHRPWEAEKQVAPGVRVSMILDGEPVGGIAAQPAAGVEVADTDLAILHVLANQAAVALHNSFLVHATTQLRGRTEQLSVAAARQAQDLATRNAELAETQRRLTGAMQRQVLDDERHRIARELHDSVTQDVLSAGMTVEVCRAQIEARGDELTDITSQLDSAKELTRRAVERLRTAIYALHHTSEESEDSLPAMLERLSTVHLPSELQVTVTVTGTPVDLPGEVEHALLQMTGEALFNTVSHTPATQSRVRLRYRSDRIVLSVADDGGGDAVQLRRMLRVATATNLAGRHRGLANMLSRTCELGGTLAIRRSRIGGIMVRMEIPVPPQRP